jgi:putative methionine-R-sulfoxide reductase with GAF domain
LLCRTPSCAWSSEANGACDRHPRDRLADVARDPRYLTALPSTGSELIAPVIVGGRVVGTLDVEDERTRMFAEEDRLALKRAAREMVPLSD